MGGVDVAPDAVAAVLAAGSASDAAGLLGIDHDTCAAIERVSQATADYVHANLKRVPVAGAAAADDVDMGNGAEARSAAPQKRRRLQAGAYTESGALGRPLALWRIRAAACVC
jgi:hypothetical protein